MTSKHKSFSDQIHKVFQQCEGRKCHLCDLENLDTSFNCSPNQFIVDIEFPDLTFKQVSGDLNYLLGFDNGVLSSDDLVEKVNSNDIEGFTLLFQHLCEFVFNNKQSLQQGNLLTTSQVRLRHPIEGDCFFHIQHFYWKSIEMNDSFTIRNLFTKMESNIADEAKLSELKSFMNLFSKRELQILTLMSEGKKSNEIGDILEISKHTVDTHRRNMLAKTNFCNTTELVAYSISNQFIQPIN